MGHISLSKLGSTLMVGPAWLSGFGKEWQMTRSNRTWSCFKFKDTVLGVQKASILLFFILWCLYVCSFVSGKSIETRWKQRNVILPQDTQPIKEKKTQLICWFTASTQGQTEKQDKKQGRTIILNLNKGKRSERKGNNQKPKPNHKPNIKECPLK